MRQALKDKVAGFPAKPGIYFFKTADGKVLYIGKARSLRDRVRSYLMPDPDVKVRNIIRETADIDYLLTGSEKEAAFLENNFVQQYQPKFNLRLKDDKSFPYLKLTLGDKYPGIYLSRKVEGGGSRYFGPFSPAGRARQTIHLVNKYFGIRGCEDAVFRGRKRPCLEYDIGLCAGPCTGLITGADYRENTDNARLFLEGRTDDLMRSLKDRMAAAAEARKFEEAARWRDLLRTLEDIKQRPRVISVGLEDLDVAGFARSGDAAALHIFLMRGGKIRDSRGRVAEGIAGGRDAEILGDLLGGFYETEAAPAKVVLPFEPSGREWERSGPKTRTMVPKSGKYRRLVELANRNADLAIRNREKNLSPVARLAAAIGMDREPRRIEGFDISNTGGDESVGSLVVFEDGTPKKSDYRKFKVRSVEGPDDTASLEEVIRRRVIRLKDERRPMPDLVMVDGGKGQLAAALKALDWTGTRGIPVISLAKKEEIIFKSGSKRGIRLDRTDPALKLVQHIRDEAHRFAIAFHRKRREKKSFRSVLDGIPGLGPARRKALLTRFGNIAAIRSSSEDEIAAVIGRKAAAAVKSALTQATAR
jgi:excinuclease ABC subunit C